MARKNNEWKCPVCGEEYDVVYDSLEPLDSLLGQTLLSQVAHCEKCGANWENFYEMRYIGYDYDGESYDAEGEKE